MSETQPLNSHPSKDDYFVLLGELCCIAAETDVAIYDRRMKTPGIFNRIVVVPEKLVRQRNHPYYHIAIPRSFRTESNSCFLVAVELWKGEDIVSRTALYLYCYGKTSKGLLRGNSTRVEYGDNLIGEDCYWDETLLKRLAVILNDFVY